jgi:phosphatidylglycerol---prolipoprotein diacylglyceryl transferase
MRRILISWRGWNLYSYPTMLYVGMVCGILVAAWVAGRSGLDPDRFVLESIILSPLTLIGARLFFVASHWDFYRKHRARIWRRSEGGMAMYGGLLAVAPLSILLLHIMALSFGKFWDAATFAMLVGMIFTRFGCLLNGCCSGRPSESWLALNLPDHRGIRRRRVPTQLLEAAYAMVLLAAAFALRGRQPFDGAIFCATLLAYGIGRTFLQKLRDDAIVRDTGIIQVTSVMLALAGLIGMGVAWTW